MKTFLKNYNFIHYGVVVSFIGALLLTTRNQHNLIYLVFIGIMLPLVTFKIWANFRLNPANGKKQYGYPLWFKWL